MIEKSLNKAEALELFRQNCALHYHDDAVEEHRIAELFGPEIARYVFEHNNSWMKPGADWNASGSCAPDDPSLNYYYLSGFMLIVAAHNHRLQVKAHASSDGGKIMDVLRKEWRERIAALDAEDARKREERKAKRAAAKARRESAA